jgi:hypothetical protein
MINSNTLSLVELVACTKTIRAEYYKILVTKLEGRHTLDSNIKMNIKRLSGCGQVIKENPVETARNLPNISARYLPE